MIEHIQGLHHVTSLAKSARETNRFFTEVLGLRRVKKTVNFDSPDVYHLYYGDEAGTPGTVMTYFPFPNIARGRAGAGEVNRTLFSVPKGALPYWQDRLSTAGVAGLSSAENFGEAQLLFQSPDGEHFALVEIDNDLREPWTGGGVDIDHAIRGFRGAAMRLQEMDASQELIRFMGYELSDMAGDVRRFIRPDGNGADIIDLQSGSDVKSARQGAGSVHHIAFAVADRAAQLDVREKLLDTGYQVTPVIDRDYFWAIYFRMPGGVLFEVATNEPGFDRDEAPGELGEALKLPTQHEHLRSQLEQLLEPVD